MTRWIQNPSRRKCTCQKDVAAVARAEESQPRFLGFRESCYSLRQRTVLCRFVCPFVLHSGRKQPPVIRDQIVFRFGPRPDFLAKKTVVLNYPAIAHGFAIHSPVLTFCSSDVPRAIPVMALPQWLPAQRVHDPVAQNEVVHSISIEKDAKPMLNS